MTVWLCDTSLVIMHFWYFSVSMNTVAYTIHSIYSMARGLVFGLEAYNALSLLTLSVDVGKVKIRIISW